MSLENKYKKPSFLISIIAAISRNHVIGCKDAMPWYIPHELRRFRKITKGKVLIMGRKTFESIQNPLKDRNIIVLSRQNSRRKTGAKRECYWVDSWSDAFALAESFGSEEVFVAGGAMIYQQAIPFADRIYLSVIDQDYEGDAYFPHFHSSHFQKVYQEYVEGVPCYTFYVLERILENSNFQKPFYG